MKNNTMDMVERAANCNRIINCMRSQNKMGTAMDDVGFNWEYGSGIFGKFMEENTNLLYEMLISQMNLHYRHCPCAVFVHSCPYNSEFTVLMPPDDNPDNAITEDDFSELINRAMQNEELQNAVIRFWCIGDCTAKEDINRICNTEIIGVRKYLETE